MNLIEIDRSRVINNSLIKPWKVSVYKEDIPMKLNNLYFNEKNILNKTEGQNLQKHQYPVLETYYHG